MSVEGLEKRELLSVVNVAGSAELAAAVAAATPGTTIDVAAGNYNGFQLSVSGTASAPIVANFASGAVLNGTPGDSNGMIDLTGDSYVTINGADVADGSDGARAAIWGGGYADDNVTGLLIENSTFNDCTDWGGLFGFVNDSIWKDDIFSNTQVQHGLYIGNSSNDDTVEGCTFFGNYACGFECNEDATSGGPGYGSGLVINGNIFYDNAGGAGASINFDGVQNSIIENNLIYDAQRNGIALYQINGALPSTGNVIVNNTIDLNSESASGYAAISLIDGAADCTILNNILSAAENTLSISANSQIGLVCNYNVFSSAEIDPTGNGVYDGAESLSRWQSLGFDKNSVEVSNIAGLFVSGAGGNFNLVAGAAAAIGTGTASDAPGTDLLGNARPTDGRYDMGAIQYQGVTAAPPAGITASVSLEGPTSATVGVGAEYAATITTSAAIAGPVSVTFGIGAGSFTAAATQTSSDVWTAGESYTFKNPSAGGDEITALATGSFGTVEAANTIKTIVAAAPIPEVGLSGPDSVVAGTSETWTATSNDLSITSFQFSLNGTLFSESATEETINGVEEMVGTFTFTLEHVSHGGDTLSVEGISPSGDIKGSKGILVVVI